MSRIHEALKMAELKRVPTGSAEATEPADSAGPGPVHGHPATRPVPPIILPLRPEAASPVPPYSRGEELWERCAKPAWKFDPDYDVFSNNQSFAGAEQFRTLRSRLYRLRGMKPLRTLVVTSTVAEEGKTFVALNLAQAIVRQYERRALLIDADLRASKLHVVMGAPVAPGLGDYLRGEADEFSIVQANSQDNFFFIPAGSSNSNPLELLANQRLKSLLDRMTPLFDWVIFDAPPVLPVSDATVLGELCDGVIMVVRAASTAFDLAQTACQEFKERNLLGVVLNRAEEEAEKYGAYGYYGVRQEGQEAIAGPPVSSSKATSRRRALLVRP